MAQIGFGADVFVGDRLEKARPTGPGVKLRVRAKERKSAAHARIDASLMVIMEYSTERPLGSLCSSDRVLFGCKLRPPFFFGLDDTRNVDWISKGALGRQKTNRDVFWLLLLHGLIRFSSESPATCKNDEGHGDERNNDQGLDKK